VKTLEHLLVWWVQVLVKSLDYYLVKTLEHLLVREKEHLYYYYYIEIKKLTTIELNCLTYFIKLEDLLVNHILLLS